MTKFIGISSSIIIILLAGCTTAQPTHVYPAVTPNPAIAHYPAVKATTYNNSSAPTSQNTVAVEDTPDTTTTQLRTHYPTGIGINVNGYGPSNANFYEAGFFSDF